MVKQTGWLAGRQTGRLLCSMCVLILCTFMNILWVFAYATIYKIPIATHTHTHIFVFGSFYTIFGRSVGRSFGSACNIVTLSLANICVVVQVKVRNNNSVENKNDKSTKIGHTHTYGRPVGDGEGGNMTHTRKKKNPFQIISICPNTRDERVAWLCANVSMVTGRANRAIRNENVFKIQRHNYVRM